MHTKKELRKNLSSLILQKRIERNKNKFGQPMQESNLLINTVIGDKGGTEKTVPKVPLERTPSFPLVRLYYTTRYIKVNNFIIQNPKKNQKNQKLSNVITIVLQSD